MTNQQFATANLSDANVKSVFLSLFYFVFSLRYCIFASKVVVRQLAEQHSGIATFSCHNFGSPIPVFRPVKPKL